MESGDGDEVPDDSLPDVESEDDQSDGAEHSLSLAELRRRMRGDGYSWIEEVISYHQREVIPADPRHPPHE